MRGRREACVVTSVVVAVAGGTGGKPQRHPAFVCRALMAGAPRHAKRMEMTMANQKSGGSGGSSGGGKSNPGNFANDRQKASEAGRMGGQHQGKENNPGNFANDREKAAEAGRKGGQQSHSGGGGHRS